MIVVYRYPRDSSISSEEIVPDLTVKSASSTNILERFPSDLLETSVDPDIGNKNTHSISETGTITTSDGKVQNVKKTSVDEQDRQSSFVNDRNQIEIISRGDQKESHCLTSSTAAEQTSDSHDKNNLIARCDPIKDDALSHSNSNVEDQSINKSIKSDLHIVNITKIPSTASTLEKGLCETTIIGDKKLQKSSKDYQDCQIDQQTKDGKQPYPELAEVPNTNLQVLHKTLDGKNVTQTEYQDHSDLNMKVIVILFLFSVSINLILFSRYNVHLVIE